MKVKIFFIILVLLIFTSCDISNNKIGIIEIKEAIMSSEEIVNDLNNFLEDESIAAIVVRMNTPGGAVAPSQEIYDKVRQGREIKPIVTSIESMGASGGYYIAVGSSKIVANPGSITGSIGVIMGYPYANEMFDKIGLQYNTIKSGKYKDSGSMYRVPNTDDSLYFQNIVDNLNSQFVKVVSEERNINYTFLEDTYATGEIFTGLMAYEYNLIDTLGNFEDALNIAAKLSNISDDYSLVYPQKDELGLLGELLLGEVNIKEFFNYYNYSLPMYKIK